MELDRDVKKLMNELLFSQDKYEKVAKKVEKTFKRFDKNLDEQIKDGYLYQLTGGLTLVTGSGGVRDTIKVMREGGLPDWIIAQDIYVTEDDSLYTNTKWYWIGDIEWKKKE